MDNIYGVNLPPDFNHYLLRPRINRLLESAVEYPLVIVCAGAGYGKTRAVYSFLQEYDAHVSWHQISERDNIATRFWESYTETLSLLWPDAVVRLRELGFPDTEEKFAKLAAVMRGISSLPGKHISLFDDFHLLHNPVVLEFFKRSVSTLPPNVTLLLISRTMPEMNLMGMMMHTRVFTIQEDSLCFTEDEIRQYLGQLNLPVSMRNVRDIYDDTQGWAFAVNLIGRSLGNERKYTRYALDALKKNIARLIETEISKPMSKTLLRFLLRLSLIDHLAADLVRSLAESDVLIHGMETLSAFIRYDYRMDTYLIHHLFLDYLRGRQGELTDAEKRETYQKAGDWCDANNYHMDAFSYFEKCGDYGAIARKVGTYNIQMPPDMATYAVRLFDGAPDDVKFGNPIFPGLHIRLKISAGQFDREALDMARRYAEDYEQRPDSPVKFQALAIIYFNWAFLLMFMSTYTDTYDFDSHFKKLGEAYARNPFKTIGKFNLVPISAWASLVGTDRAGAQEEYIEALSQSIPDASVLGKGFLVGFDDLAWGELYYLRENFVEAEQYLNRSAEKAYERDQYVTGNLASIYLMRIAFARGDLAIATDMLKSMEARLSEDDFGARQTMYDIARGFYHLSLEEPEQVPEWLKGEFSPYMHPAFLENFANRVRAQYRFQTRQYSALLAFLDMELEKRTILFSSIEMRVLQALSLHQLKRRSEAIAALAGAYQLSESNGITILFMQHAKDMRTLTANVLKDGNSPLPRVWLEDINRKSSTLAKRKAKMISDYRAAAHIEEEVSLSVREMQVLKDMSQGLSRAEIAACQDLSVNTVKMVVNTIYDKLGANSLIDAIRIAADKKLI